MQHPYPQVAPALAHYWAAAIVKPDRRDEALKTGERLLRDRAVYEDLEAETDVKALWTMCTNERESGGKLNTYLGNGDPLNRVTRDVPRNRGPFSTWKAGAKDALHLDHIDAVKVWNPSMGCFEWITYNGWGYGTASPYLLGGTDLQQPGKFTSDGHFNPNVMDEQLGCIAIAWGILQHAPELAFAAEDVAAAAPATIAVPITLGGSQHDAKWLQAALNHFAAIDATMRGEVADMGGPEQLDVDGNAGRQTRLFVRAFETVEGLTVDRGFAGPQVLGALDRVLPAGWAPQLAA